MTVTLSSTGTLSIYVKGGYSKLLSILICKLYTKYLNLGKGELSLEVH